LWKIPAALNYATTYLYDAVGNLKAERRRDHSYARGIVTAMSYDDVNRLKTKDYGSSGTPAVNYTYDTPPQVYTCPSSYLREGPLAVSLKLRFQHQLLLQLAGLDDE